MAARKGEDVSENTGTTNFCPHVPAGEPPCVACRGDAASADEPDTLDRLREQVAACGRLLDTQAAEIERLQASNAELRASADEAQAARLAAVATLAEARRDLEAIAHEATGDYTAAGVARIALAKMDGAKGGLLALVETVEKQVKTNEADAGAAVAEAAFTRRSLQAIRDYAFRPESNAVNAGEMEVEELLAGAGAQAVAALEADHAGAALLERLAAAESRVKALEAALGDVLVCFEIGERENTITGETIRYAEYDFGRVRHVWTSNYDEGGALGKALFAAADALKGEAE